MTDFKVSEISERLASKAPQVAAMLLPSGKEYGQQWLCGDLAGNPGESLKITIHSTYAGQWRDWASDDHGDLLDLWRAVKGLTPAEAIKEAKTYLGIVDPVRRQEIKHYVKPPAAITKPLSPDGQAIKYLTEKRKLSREVIAALRIEGIEALRDNVIKRAIAFQSFSPKGELINRSYRTLEAKKDVWQDKGCAPSLFGWHALPESAYKDRRVTLSEGQIDCASWLQWGVPCLSLPNGSGTTWVDYEWDNLAPFDTIYLAFDQDNAGQEIVAKVVARLGKHRCMIVSMPKKDANECLQSGYTAEDAAQWIKSAKYPSIDKFITAADLEERTIESLRDKGEPFTLGFFKGPTVDTGFYIRPGEVTAWAGYTGGGKSTLLNFLQSVLVADQCTTFVASMEMKPEILLKRLITIFYGERISPQAVKEFCGHAGHLLLFADIIGFITQEVLLEMMEFAFRRYGATHYIIDSLMRIDGLEEEYALQGAFCNRLQEFAKRTNTHVHLVCHLAKPNGKSPTAKPSMYSVKGSSLIINNVDNVALVSRNAEKDKLRKENRLTTEQAKGMYDTEVIIEKQRETGFLKSYRLLFDSRRYSFQSVN